MGVGRLITVRGSAIVVEDCGEVLMVEGILYRYIAFAGDGLVGRKGV